MDNGNDGWEMRIRKDDLISAQIVAVPRPTCGPGRVLLRVERVGMSANNVTYAALGNSFRYWEFFPTEQGYGLVPLWGFADVVESGVEGVEVGERFYGYYPSASHLLTTPGRIDERGFGDAAEHRRGLPSPYNTYARTTTDAAYRPEEEDLLVLYRPLFLTSLMWADWILERDGFGASRIVFSSASSKTAYGAAFCLRLLEAQGNGRARMELVGLTSQPNREFTTELGLYDEVITYDELAALGSSGRALRTVYADFSGNAALTARVRDAIGAANLAQHVVVGMTSQETGAAGVLAGVGGNDTFFAPVQVRHRIDDWGLAGVDDFLAQGWREFVEHVPKWVDITTVDGPEGLRRTWGQVQAGMSNPRNGHIIVL